MPGPNITIVTVVHPTGLWITVPITVGPLVDLVMVFDPGSPSSAISPAAEVVLEDHGLLSEPRGAPSHLLTNLTVQDQPLPDLRVRVLNRLARLVGESVT